MIPLPVQQPGSAESQFAIDPSTRIARRCLLLPHVDAAPTRLPTATDRGEGLASDDRSPRGKGQSPPSEQRTRRAVQRGRGDGAHLDPDDQRTHPGVFSRVPEPLSRAYTAASDGSYMRHRCRDRRAPRKRRGDAEAVPDTMLQSQRRGGGYLSAGPHIIRTRPKRPRGVPIRLQQRSESQNRKRAHSLDASRPPPRPRAGDSTFRCSKVGVQTKSPKDSGVSCMRDGGHGATVRPPWRARPARVRWRFRKVALDRRRRTDDPLIGSPGAGHGPTRSDHTFFFKAATTSLRAHREMAQADADGGEDRVGGCRGDRRHHRRRPRRRVADQVVPVTPELGADCSASRAERASCGTVMCVTSATISRATRAWTAP